LTGGYWPRIWNAQELIVLRFCRSLGTNTILCVYGFFHIWPKQRLKVPVDARVLLSVC
jgi:hypothetical protein